MDKKILQNVTFDLLQHLPNFLNSAFMPKSLFVESHDIVKQNIKKETQICVSLFSMKQG